jgi:hypothetical protein
MQEFGIDDDNPVDVSVEHTMSFIDWVVSITKDHKQAGKPTVFITVKHEAIDSIMAYKHQAKQSLRLTAHMLNAIAQIRGLR